MGVDDRGHGICRVVESVDELEPERDQQRHPEQHEWKPRSGWHPARADIRVQAVGDEKKDEGENAEEHERGAPVKTGIEVWSDPGRLLQKDWGSSSSSSGLWHVGPPPARE